MPQCRRRYALRSLAGKSGTAFLLSRFVLDLGPETGRRCSNPRPSMVCSFDSRRTRTRARDHADPSKIANEAQHGNWTNRNAICSTSADEGHPERAWRGRVRRTGRGIAASRRLERPTCPTMSARKPSVTEANGAAPQSAPDTTSSEPILEYVLELPWHKRAKKH